MSTLEKNILRDIRERLEAIQIEGYDEDGYCQTTILANRPDVREILSKIEQAEKDMLRPWNPEESGFKEFVVLIDGKPAPNWNRYEKGEWMIRRDGVSGEMLILEGISVRWRFPKWPSNHYDGQRIVEWLGLAEAV